MVYTHTIGVGGIKLVMTSSRNFILLPPVYIITRKIDEYINLTL